MTGMTANFALPYPSATDNPCLFDEQWCDFTEAIDAVFATFESAINRTIPVVPVAMVQQNLPVSFFNFTPIQFDTVVLDTAGMTDFDVDPFSITIPRPGRYTVAAGISKPTAAGLVPPIETSIFIQPNADAQSELIDRGAGLNYLLNTFYPVETNVAGAKIRLSFSVGSANFFTIDNSWLAVVWHADTEVP